MPNARLFQGAGQPLECHAKQGLCVAVIGPVRPQIGNGLSCTKSPLSLFYQKCQQLPQFLTGNTQRHTRHRNREIRDCLNHNLLSRQHPINTFLQFLANIRGGIGLEYITGSINIPGINGILAVSCHKHNAYLRNFLPQPLRQTDTVQARHFHIQKSHIRNIIFCPFQSFFSALKQFKTINGHNIGHSQFKIIKCWLLVIHINDFHLSSSFRGIHRVTVVPAPIRLSISIRPPIICSRRKRIFLSAVDFSFSKSSK